MQITHTEMQFMNDEWNNEIDRIGWLWKSQFLSHLVVVCDECKEDIIKTYIPRVASVDFTPIYKVNIGNYNQNCKRCDTTLVIGTLGWPQLFD